MSGDWMKIELELPDKPEVHAMAGVLCIDPDCVVGKLIRVWQWFDKHTTDGNAHGVTYSLPDRISGVAGFGEAMSFVGWLEQHDKTLHMPKFDRHTSESAKARALTAKRVANHKAKTNAKGNGYGVTYTVSEALPREEKRREDNKEQDQKQIQRAPRFDAQAHLVIIGVDPVIASDWITHRKAKKAAITPTVIDGINREAIKAGMPLADVLAACCQRGWIGFKADWLSEYKNQPAKTQYQINQEATARAIFGTRKPANEPRVITGEVVA